MPKLTENRISMLHGILLIALFACASFYIGEAGLLKEISFSPMIIGIILGMLYANSLRNNLPDTWVPGIQFCSKKILRLGIILYGFRLTFRDVVNVGVSGIVIDAIIVATHHSRRHPDRPSAQDGPRHRTAHLCRQRHLRCGSCAWSRIHNPHSALQDSCLP